MKFLTCAVLALGVTAMVAEPAEARQGRNGAAAAGIAAGVLGGIAAGALLSGGAQAAPVIEEPPPVRVYEEEPEPVCRIVRRRVWLDDETYTYRRVRVCE